MQFFTKVPISVALNSISYQSKIVSLGSCFAENMGEKFSFYQFQTTTNPFGIIFNPVSIEKIIQRVIFKDYFTDEDVFFYNERWHCYEIHSELSHTDKACFLKNLNEISNSFFMEISTATHFIITLGTSWVYKTNAGEIVANCHKVPQKEFSKHLLSTIEILESLKKCIDWVLKINPKCHFIFTISPVRHIKDGYIENQVSKSHLISAVNDLVQNHSKKSHFSYFPSYEILLDELRDYRFYSQDLLHPNSTAIDYIWSRFVEINIEKTSHTTMIDVQNIQKALQHRSFNPESISHQKFLENLNEKIENIQKKIPYVRFQAEKDPKK